MRRFIIRLSVLGLLVPGFIIAGASPVPAAQNQIKVSKDAVRALYTAYNANDWSALDGIVAADAVDHDASPGQAPGREGIVQVLQGFRAAFSGDVVIDDLVGAGDKVADRIHLDGTQTGTFFGIPATGKPVHIEAIEIWRVRDGQIIEGWHVENILQLLIQLGAVPSPAGPSVTPAMVTPPSTAASPAGSPATTTTTDIAANESVVRHYYAAVNSRNLGAFDTVLAAGAIDHNPASANQPSGREGIRQEIGALLAAFPDYHVTNEDIVAEGDLVVVRSVALGTQTGPLAAIPPSGKPVQFEAMDIWRVQDGQIVEVWHIEQLLNVLIQVGAVPAPGESTTPVATPSS